ncbi:hypothetical protein F4809DRAFT_631151 [Biscogniauxia mediterranea]|nr:hypothetical protein F4809DRAFT_631151 [Biscogniauxia mediterranea]
MASQPSYFLSFKTHPSIHLSYFQNIKSKCPPLLVLGVIFSPPCRYHRSTSMSFFLFLFFNLSPFLPPFSFLPPREPPEKPKAASSSHAHPTTTNAMSTTSPSTLPIFSLIFHFLFYFIFIFEKPLQVGKPLKWRYEEVKKKKKTSPFVNKKPTDAVSGISVQLKHHK